MKKAERMHMDRVVALGCLPCRQEGHPESPAGIHHIRDGQGGSQRASHYETLPLCGLHHQHGGYGVAFHAGQEAWEEKYGTERELLAQVREELGI